ncbi:MAG: fas1 [Sphaerisporangium sp.]|nr:fas1 [Sphaerisporangium sp.]
MKIHLDENLCEAYGTCVAAAPDVFALDTDIDKAVLLIENPDESLRSDVEEAVRACPVRAIEIVDE